MESKPVGPGETAVMSANVPPPYGSEPAAGAPYGSQPAAGVPYGTPMMAPTPVMMAAPVPQFRELPVAMICPQCHASVTTTTHFENGLMTMILVLGIILLGGFVFCLCLIPLCVDACKDVEHKCPNCHSLIGKYERLKF